MGARDATVRFADVYATSRDAKARADYEALLTDLETNFASRTKARQSTRSTTQSNPGPRPPNSRRVLSGKVASSEPCSSPWSIRSSMRWKSGASRRARHPGVRSAGGRRIDNAALPRRGSTAFIGPLSAPCRASLQSPLHLAIGRQRTLTPLAMADPLFVIG